MFTGIITCTARIGGWQERDGGSRLALDWPGMQHGAGVVGEWSELAAGESIAVNGVCLTLAGTGDGGLQFDVIPETLRASALGDLAAGAVVNLERSLRLGDRLGGHMVFGHVEGIGRLRRRSDEPGQSVLEIELERGDDIRVLPKGAVTVDGVSLTVVSAAPRVFTVALIPYTLVATNLGARRAGDRVNLEMDPIGKWVSHLLESDRAARDAEARNR
ncbi:MAG: riboflavin synthase [Planctomycetes bacterium]|nr:riboflavin synthase [Planctomycetota bacterium]